MNRPTQPRAPGGALVVIGASTGGPRTLCQLLEQMPALNAAVVIVQHMPRMIQESMVRTLRRCTPMNVDLARDGETLEAGIVRVAPAEVHCQLEGNRRVRLVQGPKVHYVCPAVDVTMMSVTPPQPGETVVGVLLTGMGKDGAAGMVHLRRIGATTVAQDEASCAVFGMPMEAWNAGGTDLLLPPDRIARRLVQWVGTLPSVAVRPGPPIPTGEPSPA